jgi:hypothetical protein
MPARNQERPNLQRSLYAALLAAGLLTIAATSCASTQQVEAGAPARKPTTTSAPTSTTPVGYREPFVAIDTSGNPTLTIQLNEAQPDTGDFTLLVDGAGVYKGRIAPRAANDRERRDIDDADPPAPRDPKGPARVQIIAGVDTKAVHISSDGIAQPDASVRIIGFAQPDRNRAGFNIWIGPSGGPLDCPFSPLDVARDRGPQPDRDECPHPRATKYRIRTGEASAATATARVRDLARLFERSDWPGLYQTLAPSVAHGLTQADFVAMMRNQNIGRITTMTTTDTGKLATSNGAGFWNQQIRLVVQPPSGPTKTYTATLSLVFEGGKWCLLSTSTPTPAS